jgi:ABC-2 type transport system permease protein
VSAFIGTLTLARLAIRRDRIQLAIWVLVLAAVAAAIAFNFSKLFETDQELLATTQNFATSPVLRLFGLASGATLGAFLMLRTFTTFAVLASLMSIFAVVRHTRQNEETGRAEMVGAAPVGRHALMTAALIVTVAADIVLAVLIGLALTVAGLPAAGAFTAGAAIGAVGAVFAGVAAITAQFSSTGRGAIGMAAAVLGVAFLLSGAGNMVGSVQEGGVRVVSAWPAWLSPIGWGQQVRPFGGDHWWVFALFAAAFAVLIGVAFALAARRDLGRGLLPEGRGPATAARGLLSPIGLTWRLQRGIFLGWAAGVIVYGIVIGAISNEIEKMLTDLGPGAEFITRIGGTDQVVDAYFAAVMAMMGTVIAVYTLQVLLRMRGEETDGTLDPLLATAVSRPRWMTGYIVNAALGTTALMLIAGVTTGLAAGLARGDVSAQLRSLTEAGLVQTPAAFALAGIAIAAFGLLPRWTAALAWAGFAVSFILGPTIGALLDLPRWLLDISPFTHTPNLPAGTISAPPLLGLLAVAALLTAAGYLAFRRRDLALEAG